MALDDKIKQAQAELLAQQMLAIGNQPTSAPSPRMARAAQLAAQREAAASTESASMLRNLFSGATQIPGSVYEYGRGIAQSERPLAAFGEDVSALAGGLYEGFKQDPVGFTLDMAPIVGEIRSAMESRELSNMANEAAAAGDTALADRYRQLAAMAAAGAVPFGGIGARGAKRSAMSNIVDVPPGDARAMLNELPLQTGASELPTTPAVAAPAVRMTEGDEAMAAAPDAEKTAREMLDETLTPQETPAAPIEAALSAPSAEAKGHSLDPQLLVPGTNAAPAFKVVQSFTPNNKETTLSNIDAIENTYPDPLATSQRWMDAQAAGFGGKYLPAPPRQALIYRQDPARLAGMLDRLTPDLKAAVDEGFGYVNSIKNIYNSRIAPPETTGRLFLWGILSRGAGPAQQEGAFLDVMQGAGPFIDKAARGEFTEADLDSWKQMVARSIPEGSPGKQVTMNANAAGNLLYQLGQSTDGGPSPLTQLHNILSDPRRTGQDFRRSFYQMTNNPGIDNKVVSFIGLVAGKDDLLVMDRIQSRHLWDDGTYGGANIYDGLEGGGLNTILTGPRGLMVTEMLENGLSDTVQKAYAMVGRPQDASLGRMHWETWLIAGNQPVSHSTLQAVRGGNPIGYGVTEGKRNTLSSNMTYRQAINGPIVEYPLSTGEIVRMTPTRQKEFEAFIRDKKNGIIPKGFKISESTDRPWFEQPGVDRRKLDEAARQFENANPDGSLRSGDARDFEGRGTVSERRAQFLSDFRRDRLALATSERGVQGRADGRNLGEETGPYTRGAVSTDGRDGLLTFSPDATARTMYQSAGLGVPAIRQVPSTTATSFVNDMQTIMGQNRTAPQVEIKSPEELANYRLFRTDAGSGFAIKPDGDIVSVFASPSETRGSSYAMMQAAVQAGGRKLDAFDTYLPDIYQRVGFRPVARIPWNDQFAPPNWNKDVFRAYNNGEPDIMFFVHDPKYFGEDINVPYAKDYDDAVRMQTEELNRLSPSASTQEPLSQQPTGILATSAFADRIANLPEPADIGGYRGVTVSQTPRMQNNPVGELFNREIVSDVEGAMSAYARIPATKNGKVIDTDLFRELSPEYRENRALASNVHEPASELNRAYFTRLLERTRGQEGTWLFTGGGPASGKSAAVSDEVESSAQAVVDGTMGKPDRVVRDVNRVLEDPTKDVSIVYIDRDPVKAFDLALKRSMSMEQNTGSGRTIPVKDFLDMHAASRRSIQKIYEQLGDNPRVDIQIWDNNGNAGEQFLTTVDKISTFDYDTTAERVMTRLENAYDSGEISESVYRGYKTGGDPRRSGSGGASEGASGADASSDRPLNEESGQGAAQGNTVKPRGSLEDALTQLDITPQRMEEWRSSREGMRQEKVPQVQQAAEALREGKISTEEYQRTVQQYQPIKPLAAVQKMPTVEEIAMALGKNAEKSAGIVGVNVDLPDGTPVASRLDIPAYEKYDTWVVSLHDGSKAGGPAIGYGQAAVINNVDFMSSAKAALNIATGKSAKGTIARMYGSWENRDPQAVAQQARDILSGKAPDAADWAEVGMNPFRHSYFYRKSDGMPVASAEQVIQVGPLVLAKKPVTRPVESPEHEVNTPEGPRYFKKGGNVERVTNDNRKYF